MVLRKNSLEYSRVELTWSSCSRGGGGLYYKEEFTRGPQEELTRGFQEERTWGPQEKLRWGPQ
jgi:hypothetical protein